MAARSKKVFIRKRPKKTNKPPSKKERAQMIALSELGMGTYEIGDVMGRAPNTIRKYIASPMFQDEKFTALIEEYKAKELIDLTALNIESRARLHDLVPTMSPIEAIALMDKSFQQRRLLEGKSTENIFSLRKIISEAHEVPHAATIRQEQVSISAEYTHGDSGGEAAEASRGDSVQPEAQEEKADQPE